MIYALIIVGVIACSAHTDKCFTEEIPQIDVRQLMLMNPEYMHVDGIHYDKVEYYIAVNKGEGVGPMKPTWVTENYEVYPTHNYHHEIDAAVYFSKELNEFKVRSKDGFLEKHIE